MGDMGNVIGAILLGVVAIACFVVSYFQDSYDRWRGS